MLRSFLKGTRMRLYSGKIPNIAQDLIRKLKEEGDIEVSDVPEAQLDVEAVLKEYLRLDRELTEKAKDHMEKRRLPYEQLLKIKRSMAEERDIGIGDESVSYIANQILEAFMHSRFIDEVFGDDGDMRKKIQVILRKHIPTSITRCAGGSRTRKKAQPPGKSNTRRSWTSFDANTS